MKENQFTKDIQALRAIALTSEEKGRVLLNVLRETGASESAAGALARAWRFFTHRPLGAGILALSLLIIAGTGTAAAAENSLPGDLLYPVKTSVTERFFDALAFGRDAQARRAASKAERRLTEAELLAVEGRLDKGRLENLLSRFERETKLFEEQVSTAAENAQDTLADVRLRFGAAISAHALVLEKLKARADARARSELARLEEAVEGAKEHEGKEALRTLAAPETGVATAQKAGSKERERGAKAEDIKRYEKKKLHLKQSIQDTEEKLRSISPDVPALSQDIKNTAEDILKGASQSVSEAALQEQVGKFEEAHAALENGARAAEKARVLSEQERELRGRFRAD